MSIGFFLSLDFSVHGLTAGHVFHEFLKCIVLGYIRLVLYM